MGSPNGIWSAVSGGMAQSNNIDVIANNLANSDTAGFKRDQPTFREYLTAVENPPSPAIDIPRTIFKDSDFYHFDGREHAMVEMNEARTDHSQGHARVTNSALDFAINGPGFFVVQTPEGYRFTRAGGFKVNAEGTVVTTDGYPVLSNGAEAAEGDAPVEAAPNNAAAGSTPTDAGRAPAGVGAQVAALNPFRDPPPGQEPQLTPITLTGLTAETSKLFVSNSGEIMVNGNVVGKFAVAEFSDPSQLKKTTSTLFANDSLANVPRASSSSQIMQGFLESSNVNALTETMEMLKANRAFEANMKAIRAYNDMAGKEANEVGKL